MYYLNMTAYKVDKVVAFQRLEIGGIANWLKNPETWNKEKFALQIRKAMIDAYGLDVEIDEHLITMLADQMDTYVKAAHKLLTEDLVETANNGARMANPNQKIRDSALAKIMQLLTMLGLVPAGRPKRANTPTDIDELLAGPKYA
jgi:P27 family predicted phage terminase small subunit